MKKIFLSILLLIILTGCQEEEQGFLEKTTPKMTESTQDCKKYSNDPFELDMCFCKLLEGEARDLCIADESREYVNDQYCKYVSNAKIKKSCYQWVEENKILLGK